MRFVIIGGDAAGMSAASKAKRNMPELDVTVFEQGEDVSYSACGMPYNLADQSREMDDLVVRDARTFKEKQGIDLRLRHRVEAIDRKERKVRGTLRSGEVFSVPYDYLLIATGASPTLPDLAGVDLPGVFVLKGLHHGRAIKNYLRSTKARRAVIIGMGYIALEMCEAFRALGLEVAMVKPRAAFLPWMHPELARMVRNTLEKESVRIYTGVQIKRIEQNKGSLVLICSGLELETDLVLVAAGVRPNSDLASDAGLALGPSRAVAVDRCLRTTDADIFAAGDCADAFHVVTGKKVWIPLALRANRGGWAVADTVTGKETSLDGVAGTSVFKVFDLEVAKTGLNAAEAKEAGFNPAEVVIESRSRAHAHPGSSGILVNMAGDKISGRLLGVQMVGREGTAHRINAASVALHQHMTVEAFSQCDLAYAPPFSPVWDPLLTAANQLLKIF
ncbi:MAG: pyridine nucleotide-disulfide oxidoreductase [Desulfobacteraceae bacterium]|jgi:NADPH-dependent 2,4-dienoyl-CoA reductase/sulfur reductase-like enzyme|nr:MAG: pyridine nucleotide-disulfide oxidoreductase [Desulfobacteraceae bacterium]